MNGELLGEIREEAQTRRVVMFLGAGVSVPAGLPTWKDALNIMADSLLDEKEAREFIDLKLEQQDYLGAASLLEREVENRPGDRATAIREVFSADIDPPKEIVDLAEVDADAVITTNYDNAFEKARYKAKGGDDLVCLRNERKDFDAALRHWQRRNYFVLHPHGNANVPDSVALAEHTPSSRISDFREIYNCKKFEILLRQIFTQSIVLFLGFSFSDPNLRALLSRIDREIGSSLTASSYLITSKQQDTPEVVKNSQIKVFTYEQKDDHKELWEFVDRLADTRLDTGRTPELSMGPGVDVETTRLESIAKAAYAHLSADADVKSAVYSGIVRAVASDLGDLGDTDSLIAEVRDQVGCSTATATEITASVESLETGNGSRTVDKEIRRDVQQLVGRIRDRANIRYDTDLPYDDATLRALLLRILLTDGVRLARSFLAQEPVTQDSVTEIIEHSVDRLTSHAETQKTERILTRSILDLFAKPSEDEAKFLGSISQTAYVTDVILNMPEGLPETSQNPGAVYLDANVALPLVARGHPLRPIYRQLFSGLSSRGAAIKLDESFVEEMQIHWNKAKNQIDEFEGSEMFVEHVAIEGPTSVNTFWAGFYAWLTEDGAFPDQLKEYDYDKYLHEYLDAGRDTGIRQLLEQNGISVEGSVEYSGKGKNRRFVTWKGVLSSLYDEQEANKSDDIVEHEAALAAKMHELLETGENPIVVTMDLRYLEAVADAAHRFSDCRDEIAFHYFTPEHVPAWGEALGRNTNWRSYAELMWSVSYSEKIEPEEEYYIDKVLLNMEPDVIEDMGSTVEELRRRMKDHVRASQLIEASSETAQDFTASWRGFEDEFYKNLSDIKSND